MKRPSVLHRAAIRPHPLPYWAAAGLVAGLALVGAMLALRLLGGARLPPEVAQDRLLQVLPGRLTGFLIERLQFRAKPLIFTGWIIGQTFAATLAGIAFGRMAQGWSASPPRLLIAGALPGALLWAAIYVILFPALGLGLLGSGATGGAASSLWWAPVFVMSGLVLTLTYLLLRPADDSATAERTFARRPGRRHALGWLLAGGVSVFAGIMYQRTLDSVGESATPTRRSLPPAAVAAPPSGAATVRPNEVSGVVDEITPTDEFYVVSKNLFDPRLSADTWTLEVTGLVERPLRLSYADLLALPAVDLFATLECISNVVGGDLISTARWSGVPLGQALDLAGVQEGAAWLIFRTADSYTEHMPLERGCLLTTLLAHSMNGAPLTAEHGFPCRILSTGRYGMKNPKWLTTIEVAAAPVPGFWERSGWSPGGGVATMARLDTRFGRLNAGTVVPLGGVAFAGDRGISRVEVSVDGGVTWSPAALRPPLSAATWVIWSSIWRVDPPGRHHLVVRAVDGAGEPQVSERRTAFPSGATGYHALEVLAR